MRATNHLPLGRALALIAMDLDDLAGRIEHGVQGPDVEFLEFAHLHVQIAAERVDDALSVIYEAEERELRWDRATVQERRDAASVLTWRAAAA